MHFELHARKLGVYRILLMPVLAGLTFPVKLL
jgi:hypothetical protein